MTKGKSVLIVAPYFFPHTGGLERYTYELARRTAATGVRVIVVTSSDSRKDATDSLDGMTIYRLGYSMKISNTPFGFLWWWKIRRIIRDERPDVLNIHMPVPGLGDIAARATRVPILLTYHANSMRKGMLISDLIVWIYEHLILPLLLRRAAWITTSSDIVREEFLKKYIHKSETITPGVDVTHFAPDARARGKRLLFVASEISRSSEHKGLSILLEAFRQVHASETDAKLTIVGDGDMRAQYEARVAALGLGAAVEFRGVLRGEALVDAYRSVSVFVHPSLNDSSPMVIIEAMSCALPVVSTRVGGIPSIVDDGKTGFIVEPHDSLALADKIVTLLRDQKRAQQCGRAGQRAALERYDWNSRVRRFGELFEWLSDKRAPIVQVSAYYPPHLGGVERVVKTASEMFAAQKMPTIVITSDVGARGIGDEIKPYMTVKRLRTFEFAHTPFTPRLFFALMRVPRKSIMHVHLAQAYWPEIVRLVCAIRRMRYIVHFHLDVAPSGLFGSLFVIYKKLTWGPLLRGAQKVIVCSGDQIEIVCGKYGVKPERAAIVPNGVDQSFFSDRVHRAPEDAIRLLYIGRLAPQKRLDRLIDALAMLSAPAHLTIVGDGEDRAALEARVNTYGLTNVAFVGKKDDSEMQRLQRESDVFVITSEREGAPLSVLEAMASGLPIVGTDVIGIRELITGVGLLVGEPYAQNLALAIERLRTDPKQLQEMSTRSREAAWRYSWTNLIGRLGTIYRDLSV